MVNEKYILMLHWYLHNIRYNQTCKRITGLFIEYTLPNYSHKKRKDSLEGSLGRVLLAAEPELPKTLVPRLSQHTSGVNIECVKITVFFICDQLFGALKHLNYTILILICFWLMMPGVDYVICGCSSARTTPGTSLCWTLTQEENIAAVITQGRVLDDNLKRQIKNQTLYL